MSNNISIINDPVLQEIINGYMPNDGAYIHTGIIPNILVGTRRGDIKTGGTEHLRVETDIQVGKSGIREITVSMTKAAGWSCKASGLKISVLKEDWEEFINISSPNTDAAKSSARQLFTKLLMTAKSISREKEVADIVTSTSVITQNATLSGTAQWNDYTNSTPITDIKTGKKTIYSSTGLVPNVAYMSWEVFEDLQFHPSFLNLITTDSTNERMTGLTLTQMAKALKVQKVLVGNVKYETAKEGQTSSLASVWGKDFGLMYVNPNPNPNKYERSFGYNFVLSDVNVEAFNTHEQTPDSEMVRITDDRNFLVINADSAYLIKNAVA